MSSLLKEAVILAAGFGNRLSDYTGGKSKLLIPIDEIPLILYPTYTLYLAGVRKICYIVNRWNRIDIMKTLARFDGADTCFIINDKPEKGNGYSFLLCKKCVKSESFILSMADHIYHLSIIRKLARAAKNKFDIIIGGDSEPKYIEISEATKIMFDGDNVVRIGKKLKKFTHVDIGVFVIKKKILEEFKFSRIRKLEFTDIIKHAVNNGYNVKLIDVNGAYWTEVDTINDIEEIEYGRRREVIDNVLSVFYEKLPFHNEILRNPLLKKFKHVKWE